MVCIYIYIYVCVCVCVCVYVYVYMYVCMYIDDSSIITALRSLSVRIRALMFPGQKRVALLKLKLQQGSKHKALKQPVNVELLFRSFKFLAKSIEDKESWCYNLELARRMFGDEADMEDLMVALRNKYDKEIKLKQQVQEKQREELEKKKVDVPSEPSALATEQRRVGAEATPLVDDTALRKQYHALRRTVREEEDLYKKLEENQQQLEMDVSSLELELLRLQDLRNAVADDHELLQQMEETEQRCTYLYSAS